MRSFNFINQKIRCVSGASLNLFRYAAMVFVLLTLGIGNAWGTSNYYASLQITKAGTTGAGQVYVSKTETQPSSEVTTVVKSDATTTSGGDRTFYYWVDVTSPGYYVTLSGAVSGTYNGNTGEKSVSLKASTTAEETQAHTATATFSEITINNGTASPATIAAEDNSVAATTNTCTVTYSTKGDNTNDFKAPTIGSATGHGTFTAALGGVTSDGGATVNVTFKGDGTTYGGNVAAGSRSRTSTAVITLTSAVGNNKGTCTVTASFPNIIIGDGSFDHMTTINTVPKSATATFPVQWADDVEDFSASFGSETGGGAWTVDGVTYTATDARNGTISIDYTFNPNSVTGDHSALLTLAANANAGGASKTLTLTAESEKLADNDASIGETEYKTLAEAITAANGMDTNPTVKILRNVEGLTSALEIKKPMTIDLNSFTVSGTLTSSVTKLFYLNTATAVLTINDSRNGGKISATGNDNAILYTVLVDKGSLVLTKGDIEIKNINTGTSAMAITACVNAGARFSMTAGNLVSTSAGATACGLMTITAPTAPNMIGITGGSISATTASKNAIGILAQSSSATDAGDPTNPNIVLSNVTINADATGTTDAFAIRTNPGVCLLINSGTYNATAKTTTARAILTKGYTAIVNGSFNATAGTTDANAIRVEAGIAAVRNGAFFATAQTQKAHTAYVESGAKLLTYGGTFHGKLENAAANQYATGADVLGTLEAQGGTFIGEVAKTGLAAAQTNFAVGVLANTGSNVTLANATLRGLTDNTYVNGAYALYTSTVNPVSLTNCTLEATSTDQYAYGVRLEGGATPLTMNNCTVNATAATLYAYGFYQNNATSTIDVTGSTFNVTSSGTRAYGIYVNAGTSFSATDCDFTVRTLQTSATAAAGSYLRGIFVAAGKTANLTGCTFNVSGHATYSTDAYGLYISGSVNVENTDVTVSSVKSGYAIYNDGNTAAINIFSGKFSAPTAESNATAAAAKQQLYGGYYVHNTNLAKYLPEGYMIETLTAGTEFNAGYKYHVRPETVVNDPVCKIGSTGYATLEEALEFVNKNSGNTYTIYMVKDYTLPAGDYTLPAKATLLVPMADVTSFKDHPDRIYNSYSYPTCNMKLTFAEGAYMDVYGTIQTGGKQSAVGQISQDVKTANNGTPTVSYGWIYLSAGSTITLESGSQLYSWGYVTGARDEDGKYLCEIDAKRGSTVHESFMIKDWRGGSATLYNFNGSTNKNNYKVFPLNQYYIQNIEVPIKFRPGSAEYCDGTVSAGSAARPFNDVKLIGVTNTGSFFEMANDDMSEDTWVRKWYDVANDKQVYEINSSASLNNITLSLYGTSFSSSSFVLPITNNMKIHLLTGSMNITQNTELLPGSEIEIDKEATAYITSGKSLYVFDLDEWNAFYTNEHTFPLPYSPSWAGNGKTCPRSRKVTEDAKVNVHGKFVVNGSIYTTAGGANIYSTDEDAGTITFAAAAPTAQVSVYVNNGTNSSNGQGYTERKSNSAWLQNGDGTYEETSETAKDKSWIYYDGKWNCWEEKNCFGYDAQDHPYAKPRAWVQLTSNVADETTHLYADAETGERRFLVEDGCTWWEVEPTPYDGNKYKCVDPDYDGRYKYFEYVSNKWQEAVVTITWMNGSSTLATYTKALYGVRPTYLDANPTKTSTSTDYYTWLGWTKGTETGEFYAKDAELPVATENTTYYAYFKADKFTFRATFNNYDGSLLETKLVAAGETPVYDGETPVKPATTSKEYTFTGWNPALVAISNAPVTYTAQFSEKTREYTVQWVNYNGTVLKEEKVAYGTTPTAPVDPTRPNDTYYTYTFDAWSPAVDVVSGNQTYTATYSYEKKVNKYEVQFKNGTTTIFSQNLVENSVPVFDGNEPTKDPTAQYSYTFDGWSTTNGGALVYAKNATLPALTANVIYYAHFAQTTNNYRIIWKSENGKVTLETDPTVPYGTTPSFDGATPTKDRVGKTGYEFDGWSASIGGDKLASLPNVTEDKVFYAHFLEGTFYDITFNAKEHGTAPAGYEVIGGSKLSAPEAPTETGYTFGGWYKEDACTNAWNFNSDVVNANTTLFAKWTVNKYTITWVDGNGATLKTEKVEYGQTPAYSGATPTKTATAQYTFSFAGWTPEVVTVTDNATYKATFKDVVREYTITWKDADGSALDHDTTHVQYGVSPTHVAPSREGCSFTGWKAASSGTVYGGVLPTVGTDDVFEETYTAQYTCVQSDIVVGTDEAAVISNNTTTTTTTVHVSGSLNIEGSKTLTTTTLVLEASPTGSGQITGNIDADVAYLDYTLGSSQAIWYDIAVPWEVDATTGIYVDGVQKQLNKDFYLIYYNGALRASQNKHTDACWQFVNQEKPSPDKYMHPGRLYMIYIPNTGVNKLRFERNGSGTIATPEISVYKYNSTGTDVVNAGWNGIANPAIYKAYMNAGAATVDVGGTSDRMPNFAQKYVPEANNYVVFNMAETQFRVSEPVFVQVAEERSVAVNAASFPAPAAPMRRAKVDNAYYEVQIAAGEDYTDRIFLLVVEGKEESYRIGLDLAKAGISAKVAQMWVSRYKTKLCVNTTAPKGTSATYPLGIQVPADGEYQIYSATEMQDNQQMYVTFNGRAIWNLAYGPYEVFLTQGTHTEYGLKLVQSPAVTTDIENSEAINGANSVRKVLIDNQIYIIREGAVYTINGQIVK